VWSFKKRFTISLALEETLVQRIDRWRYQNRISTRAAAIRKLIERGLEAGKLPVPPKAT
jgi:metal-responsive CopG/Arc/MetJ family transcriptional regulator